MVDLKAMETALCARAQPQEAPAMAAYMRHKFPFLGVKRPERQAAIKPFLMHLSKEEQVLERCCTLWDREEREYQYAALDILQEKLRLMSADALPTLKELLVSKPWWDTVDRLATAIVGPLVQSEQALRNEVFGWKDDGHLWLERTAILFQLKYKEDTDTKALAAVIEQFSGSEAFFHQKAIGWALRSYSRIDSAWVMQLMTRIPLKPLSVREASKYLNTR